MTRDEYVALRSRLRGEYADYRRKTYRRAIFRITAMMAAYIGVTGLAWLMFK